MDKQALPVRDDTLFLTYGQRTGRWAANNSRDGIVSRTDSITDMVVLIMENVDNVTAYEVKNILVMLRENTIMSICFNLFNEEGN